MRTLGMIPYITPRQIATESSSTPKSVMNTIVAGYFDPSAARDVMGPAISTKKTRISTVARCKLRSKARREDKIIQSPLPDNLKKNVEQLLGNSLGVPSTHMLCHPQASFLILN